MKKILKILFRYKGRILLATLLMAVSAGCDLLLPTLMSDILDNVSRLEQGTAFSVILKSCLLMLGVAAVSLACMAGGRFFADRVTTWFTRDLRSSVFKKVHTMTFEEMNQIGTGGLLSRSTHDVGTLSWVSSMVSGSIIVVPLLFIGSTVFCVLKDWRLSLILLAAVPVVLLVVRILGKKITPLWEISDKYCDVQNDVARERMRGIRIIRAFNREPTEHRRLSDATVVMADNIIRANVSMQVILPVAMVLLNLAAVAVVWVGGARIAAGSGLTPGDVFAVVQYAGLMLVALGSASFALVMLPHAKVALKRVSEVLDAEGMADAIPDEDLHFTGKIDFENVTFRYAGADVPAIDNVTLHILPGQKVSVIGGTGSGKSSLVSLMMSFRVPTSGRVLFDGRDAKTISRKTIRRNISCALQKSMIYAGTLRENVYMGNMDADDAQIEEALDIACLSDFVSGCREGVNYPVEQAGNNLSGGQKQRLAIARAVVKDAPVYIFDDSFSALDFLTESKLRKKLNEKFAGRTQIVITQRVTTAMNSDCIFVMDGGRLADFGTHSELIGRCAIYREIYASQTGGAVK